MFEYLGVLIAVILGLALTHLVRGLAKLIHERRTVKIWWPHVLWTINMMIYVLAIWFGMYWWNTLKEWSILEFFFIAAYCTVMFLLASLLYPPEFPDHLSCERHFFDNKQWFFSILIAAYLLDIPETLVKGAAHLRAVPREYIFYVPAILLIAVVGMISNNRRVQAALPVAWLAATLAYLLLETQMNTIVAAG
jgi:hypothetical protein